MIIDAREEDVMQIASYLYQSPSPSATQIGKLDPSSVKQESTEESSTNSTQTPTDETTIEAQLFEATQTTEVSPLVDSNQLLDVYV